MFASSYRHIPIESIKGKRIVDDSKQTTSPTNGPDDVAQIDTELHLTLLKREHAKDIQPLLYSKATVNRSVEFRKLQPLLSRNDQTSLKKTTSIAFKYQKDLSLDGGDPISLVKKGNDFRPEREREDNSTEFTSIFN